MIKISQILIVFVLLFVSVITPAFNQFDSTNTYLEGNYNKENHVFEDQFSAIYQFVGNHEYLFAPLSGAMAGGVRCGIWCATVGLILGIIDETLISLNYTDRHYLIWGLFGVTTGHVMKPSVMSNIIGGVVGVLLPMEVLNDHAELVAPIVSGLVASSTHGTSGLINGMIVGIIDEFAINSGLLNKHYLTFCTIGMTTTNLLGFLNSMVANSVGIVLGIFVAEQEEKIYATLITPVRITKDLYNAYNKFIPKKELDPFVEKQALVLVGCQFVIQYLLQKEIGYRQNVKFNFERLTTSNNPLWCNFQSGLTNFIVFIFPYTIGYISSNLANNYFSKKLQYVLEDKVRNELFANRTTLRLFNNRNTTLLVDNLKSDVSVITEGGGKLITGAISAIASGIYGVGIILVTSTRLFVCSSVYNQVQTFISDYFATQLGLLEEQIKMFDSNIMSVMKHDVKNIRTITEMDGEEFTKIKLQQLYVALRNYERTRDIWSSVDNVWHMMSLLGDFIFIHYLVGYEINAGRIPFDSRGKA